MKKYILITIVAILLSVTLKAQKDTAKIHPLTFDIRYYFRGSVSDTLFGEYRNECVFTYSDSSIAITGDTMAVIKNIIILFLDYQKKQEERLRLASNILLHISTSGTATNKKEFDKAVKAYNK